MTLRPVGDLPPEDEGARALDCYRALLTKYVILPSPEAADAVTLWVAATHAQPAWEHAPRLAVISPEKRCGKSRLLDLVEGGCRSPLIAVNASIAAIVRSLSENPPTLIIDEADTIFGSKKQSDANEELRGILNAGHQRNRPAIRWNITTRSLETIPTFGMACLASIGDLPDTVMDRAVVVRMRRRAAGEVVSPFRTRRDGPALAAASARLSEWAHSRIEALEAVEPDMPLEDRAADTWEPLFAVADAAGGTWPARVKAAAAALVGAESEAGGGSDGTRLLADLRNTFGSILAMPTAVIIARLRKLEEAPWNDVDGRGKPLDSATLANLLRPYGVQPKSIKFEGKTLRGYERATLADAWVRYLPSPRGATPATSTTGERSPSSEQPDPVAPQGATGVQPPLDPVAPVAPPVAPRTPTTSAVAAVAPVAPPVRTARVWELEEPPDDPWPEYEGDAA